MPICCLKNNNKVPAAGGKHGTDNTSILEYYVAKMLWLN